MAPDSPPSRPAATTLPALRSELTSWPWRRWLAAAVASTLAALMIGIPTGIVGTPFYTRMTPVTWWDYPIWATSAVLLGLTAATYLRRSDRGPDTSFTGAGRSFGAGLASLFAVGCPICNKLVVALLGVSGALTYFARIQPILGVLSVGILLAGLVLRLRTSAACPVTWAGPAGS